MSKPVFEIFKDKHGKYRFRLKAPNGEIIAASQGYASKQNCRHGIDSVKENSAAADVVEKGDRGVKIFERGSRQGNAFDASLAVLACAFAVAALIMTLF